jgi:hypothetical protein
MPLQSVAIFDFAAYGSARPFLVGLFVLLMAACGIVIYFTIKILNSGIHSGRTINNK